MSSPPLLTIVLAAGKGTRMNSVVPKVLHKIAGLSLLGHVLKSAGTASDDEVAVVVGPGMENVAGEARRLVPAARIFVQQSQQGTADAVKAAREALVRHGGDVVVAFADTPLVQPETFGRLRAMLDRGAAVAVLGFRARNPAGYGRLLTEGDRLVAIREDRDATAAERALDLCNSGVMAFRSARLVEMLDRISNANAKGEYYLTDIVAIAREAGLGAAYAECPEDEVLGVNSRDQLAGAEAIWQARARRAAMLAGVTMIAPETVWLSHDTVLGRDVTIEPNVFFGPGVSVADGVEIKANSHIEGARIGKGARIGPFARLRPGADLGADVHIGNFVEVKNVAVARGAKANHLAYLGDGSVGEDANIGAGTIFCNYDGFRKQRTEIGAGAFIGSNSALVAPVRIGEGAYVGSGSVVTKDVPPDALVLERSPQVIREGWALKFRRTMKAAKPK